MKKLSLILTSFLIFFQLANAQNIGINATGATPAASAMLDITSTDKGLLIPRVALTATNTSGPVIAPATSLLVYNTATAGIAPNNVIPGYYYWSGTAWIAFTSTAAASTAWTLGGNTGVTASNFVGTGDDKALIFKSNNLSFLEFGRRQTLGLVDGYTEYTDPNEKVTYVRSALQFEAPAAQFYKPKMWTDANGNFRVKGASAGTDYFEFGSTGTANNGGFEFIIGDDGDEPILFKSYHYINGMSEIMRLQSGRMAVGSNAFDATNPEKLLIDAGVTSSYNLMTGKGSIDNYLQINVKNSSAGGSASSDLVASSNNGNESVNYIDMGINSSAYSNTSLPVLGGANTAYLYATGADFVIGNATASRPLRFFTGGTANANERMRIDGSGRVGIANLAPTEALDVTGNFRLSGAFMPNNNAGTLGYVLQSNGVGAAPSWITPASLVSGSSWALDGNAVAANRNFGTTTNFSLPFITNNTQRMLIGNTGNVAIGTSTFNATFPEKFLVDAGTTTSVNAIVGRGSINNYLQLNIQNTNAGTNASSDVVATADNGSETTNYVDMGINSSTNTSGIMGGANDAYLYNLGQDFLIGTGTAAKSLILMTGGTSETTNERMRIDGSGNVGIGFNVPTRKLDVNGAIGTGRPSTTNGSLVFSNSTNANAVTINTGVTTTAYSLTLPTAQGAASSVLTNNGSGVLSWSSVGASGGWSTLGNSGTNPTTNFLGTTDNQALVLKVNNAAVERFEANAVAIGLAATTNNSANAYAIGSGATVGFNHPNSFVIGNSTNANSDNSFAIGNGATVAGNPSYAIGNGAASNSTNGIAIGTSSTVAFSITDGIAIGANALANSNNSIAIGGNSTAASKTSANAPNAVALGTTATANSTSSVAIGNGATTGFSLTAPVALGNGATVNGSNGVAIGNSASIGSATNSTALGASASVSGSNSTAVGYNTAVTQNNALILGDLTNTNLSVGIGTQSFSGTNREKLLVDMGTTSSVNAIVGRGTNPSYLQLNIQNLSNGNGASSDVVATADNGTETNNFVDMGINSSTNSSGVMGGLNDAYLYNLGQNLLIGTGTAAKSLVFMTGGTAQGTNERMRVSGTGLVGIGTNTPTEKLDVTGNVKFTGALMPNNVAGTSGFVLQSNGAGVAPTWTAPGSTNWALDGNAVAANRNLGTTTNFSLPFVTNNIERMRISNTGDVAIGTSTFTASPSSEKFLVDAGTTTSVNAIVGKGSINNYLQLNIQNTNAGTNASSDVVATANNGSETTNFVDMGINSGSNTSNVMGVANDAYLYNVGQNLLIGTGTAAKSLVFMTGGTTQSTNERMRIDGTGKVGIGKNAPTEALDIVGNLRFSGAIMPNNTAGNAGEVLISSGAGAAPNWLAPAGILNTISWALDGNAVASNRNIGTTTNFSLPFITNNTQRMIVSNTGNVGIGTSTFNGTNPEKLLVDVGSTTSVNGIVARGTVPTYLQLNVQNLSQGVGASSDIVATADNGTESINFVDLGINSSTYTSTGVLGGANNAYLYSTGNDFVIGNATASKNLEFFTGGTAATNERMTITGTGNVGIGINTPNSTLAINGSLTMKYRSGSIAYIILDSDYVVIHTGAAVTWTLPAATACAGRIYRLINQGSANVTLSQAVTTANATTTTALPFGTTGNFEILSDGLVWRKIN